MAENAQLQASSYNEGKGVGLGDKVGRASGNCDESRVTSFERQNRAHCFRFSKLVTRTKGSSTCGDVAGEGL